LEKLKGKEVSEDVGENGRIIKDAPETPDFLK
jgi:hypothetical protein